MDTEELAKLACRRWKQLEAEKEILKSEIDELKEENRILKLMIEDITRDQKTD